MYEKCRTASQAPAPLEHGPVGRDRLEVPAARVVGARLAGDEPGGDGVAAVKPASSPVAASAVCQLYSPPNSHGPFR